MREFRSCPVVRLDEVIRANRTRFRTPKGQKKYGALKGHAISDYPESLPVEYGDKDAKVVRGSQPAARKVNTQDKCKKCRDINPPIAGNFT